MSQETMLAAINAELNHADAATMNLVLETLRNAKQTKPITRFQAGDHHYASKSQPTPALQFVGENLTLEEYRSLEPKEKGVLQMRLKEQNHLWLREQFKRRKAAWLVVVNGSIEAWGESLKDRPLAPQNVEVSQRTGKFPFVFVNDDYMAIEESGSAWSETIDPQDSYPTLPLTLGSSSQVVKIIGDLDTGAFDTFADYEFLRVKNLLQPATGDYYEIARHLGQTYQFVSKLLHVQLSTSSGKAHALDVMINCVPDWHASPFVKINPDRVALVGRDILRALMPRVLLDFEARRTEIHSKKATKPTRAQADKTTKRLGASRKRR